MSGGASQRGEECTVRRPSAASSNRKDEQKQRKKTNSDRHDNTSCGRPRNGRHTKSVCERGISKWLKKSLWLVYQSPSNTGHSQNHRIDTPKIFRESARVRWTMVRSSRQRGCCLTNLLIARSGRNFCP